ncbi:S41 family peptidase [Radiobacillus deserti]|uniref:Tail specific protease domain-containing protein n=1 Tax=Radiobacillus deserti TaxID=2594883 RepID=A0A516KKQ3_9BACI|nr:hypothetical protein [Radiobacillus deserti]QDP41966.1 hypothetical protein FN924_18395 [Radiobacillus deserti]
MKRAEVVGERTGGGANLGNYHQVTKHIKLFIPSGRPVSPFTNDNWDGTGVEPDIEVKAEQAYQMVYEKALKTIAEKYEGKVSYEFLIEEIKQELKRFG